MKSGVKVPLKKPLGTVDVPVPLCEDQRERGAAKTRQMGGTHLIHQYGSLLSNKISLMLN